MNIPFAGASKWYADKSCGSTDVARPHTGTAAHITRDELLALEDSDEDDDELEDSEMSDELDELDEMDYEDVEEEEEQQVPAKAQKGVIQRICALRPSGQLMFVLKYQERRCRMPRSSKRRQGVQRAWWWQSRRRKKQVCSNV